MRVRITDNNGDWTFGQSLLNYATKQKAIEKILADVITHELDLPPFYVENERGDIIPCVVIYSQNIKLFNTDKMQITVKATNFTQ